MIWLKIWFPYSFVLFWWGIIVRGAGGDASLYDMNRMERFLDTGPEHFATAVVIYIVISYKALMAADKGGLK